MTQNLEAIRRFILGGQAVFTVVSKRSGARRTFRVRKGEDVTGTGVPHGYYVDLLTGPNNDSDYRYLAYLFQGIDGLRVKPNREQWGFDSHLILAWMVRLINVKDQARFELQAEFHHAGRCCVCGRTLTTPESIELGIGPICAGRGQ